MSWLGKNQKPPTYRFSVGVEDQHRKKGWIENPRVIYVNETTMSLPQVGHRIVVDNSGKYYTVIWITHDFNNNVVCIGAVETD